MTFEYEDIDGVGTARFGREIWRNARLGEAARNGDVDEAARLLDEGTDINCPNAPNFDRPLHEAVFGGHADMVIFLLSRGADVSADNGLGATPLHMTWNNRDTRIAEILLESGADLHARMDGDGPTPLHCTAGNGNPALTEYLLNVGADVHAITQSGETPLHLAARKKHRDIALCLLLHGADPSAKDHGGETPGTIWPEMKKLARQAAKASETEAIRAIRALHARVKGLRPPSPSL